MWPLATLSTSGLTRTGLFLPQICHISSPLVWFISQTLSKKSVTKRIPRINPPKSSQASVFVQETMSFSYPSPPHIQQPNKPSGIPDIAFGDHLQSIGAVAGQGSTRLGWWRNRVWRANRKGQGQGLSKPCWEAKRFKMRQCFLVVGGCLFSLFRVRIWIWDVHNLLHKGTLPLLAEDVSKTKKCNKFV